MYVRRFICITSITVQSTLSQSSAFKLDDLDYSGQLHSSVALLKYGLIAIGIIDVAAPHDDATAAWRFSVCLCISNLFFFAHPQISAAFCDCSLIVRGGALRLWFMIPPRCSIEQEPRKVDVEEQWRVVSLKFTSCQNVCAKVSDP